MKITRDTPGERLTLEDEKAPRLPAAAFGCMAVIALPFLWTPASVGLDLLRGKGLDPGSALAAGASALFGGLALLSLFTPRLGRRLFRVDFDRTAGEARLVYRRLVGGGERAQILRLDRLRGLTLRTVTAASRLQALGTAKPTDGKGLQLVFQVARGEAGARLETREVTLRVQDLDQMAEVVDFAYRVGAATGLTFARVVRNDPKAVEVELLRTREPGVAPAPWNLAKADYAHDAVAPAAREAVAHEKVAPFAPETFPSDHRVRVYEPRSRVVLRKPLGFAAVGCLPFTLLVLTGPFIFVAARFTTPVEWPMRLFISAFIGLFGAILGGVAMVMVHSALARTVTFDWSAGRAIARGTGKFDLAFSDIAALELRQVHRVSRGKSSTTHWYFCEILLRKTSTGEKSAPISVVETTHLQDDPDTGYRAALPLATELAHALGVERKITEG